MGKVVPDGKLENEEDRQLTGILTKLIYACWGMFLFECIAGILYNDSRLIVVTLLGCSALILPMVLLKRRHLRASSLFSALIILGTVTFLATIGQGIRDLTIVTIPILFIFAGLALERKYFGLLVGFALVATCWLSFGETFGWFTPVPFTAGNWVYLITLTIILLIAALAVDLLAKNIRRNLERARAEVAQRKQAEDTIRQTEAELQALFASMHDVVLVIDRDGVYRKIAPTNPEMLIKSPEELLGKTFWDFFPAKHAETFLKVVQQVLDTKQTIEIVYDMVVSDQTKWFEATISAMAEDTTLWVAHDITRRKRFELLQNAFYRITQAAITGDRIDVFCQSIHSILGELIPAENFFIALYDPTNQLISFPYYIDQYDEPPQTPTLIQGLTGYVIRTGRPLLANREVFDRLVKQGEVGVVGTVSVDWLGVPLKVEGRTIGVMVVQSYTQGIHFDQQNMDLLEFVSTQVAQAIERKRLEEEIRSLALTDELTGLYNRRGFILLAEQGIELAQRLKKVILLFYGDVDNLKAINDEQGHDVGDQALKEVSAILKECFRASDILARIGGDEFVALALDVSAESGEIITNRLQAVLEAHNQRLNRTYQLSLSVGVARRDPEALCTLSELITQADGLMYHQKLIKKENK